MDGEEGRAPEELRRECGVGVGGERTGELEACLEHRVLGQKGEVGGFLQKVTLVN